MQGQPRAPEPEFYITECTWMRKHGWRTPEWKLIHALEPDFHFKPEVELYDLVTRPGRERATWPRRSRGSSRMLEARMQALDRPAREGDRPHEPDLHEPELARPGLRPVQDLAAGVRHACTSARPGGQGPAGEGTADPARGRRSCRRNVIQARHDGHRHRPGHSGTRAMSHTLSASGVFMGARRTTRATCCRPRTCTRPAG